MPCTCDSGPSRKLAGTLKREKIRSICEQLPSSEASFKLCISTFGSTVESLEAKVERARRFDPDLIELRLDFIRNLDIKKLETIENFLEGNEILTIRSREEGGSLEISDNRRVALVRDTVAHLKPSFVDIEISTLRKYPHLAQELEGSRTKFIASFHDIRGSKDVAYLRKTLLSAPLHNKGLFATKIVSYAKTLQDNLKILSLYSPSNHGTFVATSKLVAFCTGRLGIPSRILCLFLGSPYSYASLPGEPIAAGQLDIKTMRKTAGIRM